jgi:hypothetical protein
MAQRPVIANVIDNGQYGNIVEEPILKIPNGERIVIRTKGFELIMSDDEFSIVNRKTKQPVFLANQREVVIGVISSNGTTTGEHVKFKL